MWKSFPINRMSRELSIMGHSFGEGRRKDIMAIMLFHGVFMRSQSLISRAVTQNNINAPKTTQIFLTILLIFSQLKSSYFIPQPPRAACIQLRVVLWENITGPRLFYFPNGFSKTQCSMLSLKPISCNSTIYTYLLLRNWIFQTIPTAV